METAFGWGCETPADVGWRTPGRAVLKCKGRPGPGQLEREVLLLAGSHAVRDPLKNNSGKLTNSCRFHVCPFVVQAEQGFFAS
ncbi:MAG: hypothetical protein Q7T87_19330 [Polaromonas sp.]|nr:hypothetical protein [Polaromonas sp.]